MKSSSLAVSKERLRDKPSRSELVRALARLLVEDVRQAASAAASDVAPRGSARTVVGRLHPQALAEEDVQDRRGETP